MISSVSIARSALDRSAQGADLGQALVKDAIGRRQQAEAITGSRALHVQAKDERAAAFYARFGFQPSLSDPLHVFLLTKARQYSTAAALRPLRSMRRRRRGGGVWQVRI